MSKQEVWRPVLSHPDYEVSSLGTVRKADTREAKRPSLSASGSLVVNLARERKWSVRNVHSLVAEAFLRPRRRGEMVQHLDNDPFNCAANNLHYVPLGLRQPRRGDDHGKRGKLTPAAAEEIRRRARAGESVTQLAKQFGVSSTLVSLIKSGRKWRQRQSEDVSAVDQSSGQNRSRASGNLVGVRPSDDTRRRPMVNRALVVDGQAARRARAVELFSTIYPIAGAFASADELFASTSSPAVLLLEMTAAPPVLKRMEQEQAWEPFLIYGESPNVTVVVDAIHAGAIDFVEISFDPDGLRARAEGWAQRIPDAVDKRHAREMAAARLAVLSPRECDVLRLIATGYASADIAVVLGIESKTVEVHRSNLRRKLGVKSAAALIRLAMDAGWA